MELNSVHHGDCLELMKGIKDKSIDMILCDLPYQTTASSWDRSLPFEQLWRAYERIIKDNGVIVLTANGSFTHKVVSSNERIYKYKWIWRKSRPTNFVNAKNRPMTIIEVVLVFSKANTANGSKVKMPYNPQSLQKVDRVIKKSNTKFGTVAAARISHLSHVNQEFTNYPNDILEVASEGNPLHPSQKPVPLFEYLIRTYTNDGETVLDNCAGSGTTAIACINANRNYILMEKEEKYYNIINERIASHK